MVNLYISKLGIREDEYWNNYRPEELRKYLIHLKVQDHILKEAFKNKELEKKINKTKADIDYHMDYLNKYYKANMKIDIKYKTYINKLK